MAAKVVVLPTALVGLVTRFLHRNDPKPIPFEQARRRAGIYVWRPTFGPDGMPDSEGEIIPISETAEHKKPLH